MRTGVCLILLVCGALVSRAQDPLADWIERALRPGADRAALRAELERLRAMRLDPAGLLFAEGLWLEPEQPREAARRYEEVLARYPKSPYAAHAQDRLLTYYAAQGRLDEVDRIARLRSAAVASAPLRASGSGKAESRADVGPGVRPEAAVASPEVGQAEGVRYTVQVAELADRAVADQLVRRLRNLGFTVQLVEAGSGGARTYRVWVGRFPNRAAAEQKFELIRNAVRAIQSDLSFSPQVQIIPLR
jgi:hypothetical protein